jgi:hypothetical protein
MTTWSKDELRKIAEADDLHISPFREDGYGLSVDPVAPQARPARASGAHLAGGARPGYDPGRRARQQGVGGGGSLGNPQPNYAELLALVTRQKLRPARPITREIALRDVTDTLERMTRFDTVGFEVITRFA